MKNFTSTLIFILFAALQVAQAKPITTQALPSVLQDWQAWVLYDKPEQACPFLYAEQTERYCAWPTQLTLDIQAQRIYFTQIWQVFAPSSIQLPGEVNVWPQSVQVNGQAYPVADDQNKPVVALEKGIYHIQGFLPFTDEVPESIQIPPHTALVQLSNQAGMVNQPRIDDTGRLFLHSEEASFANASLQMRVFRKITQAVPMEVLTFIELDVGGPAREVQLGPVLLPETVAMRIDSSLPAQLDDSGLLRVQLRPGKWQIEITGRSLAPIETFKRAEVGPPWPAEEIWSFVLDPRLGLMQVNGVPSVDPAQTAMPPEWYYLPAYRVLMADPVFLMQSENLPVENQLNLVRRMWLDFSGQLWTVQDQLQGSMTQHWRLSLAPPFVLGSAVVAGKQQLITALSDAEGKPLPGIELRSGQLSLDAMSLVENQMRLPVTGWDESFNTVNTTLYLPPGWQVFNAFGADEVSGTWIGQWSLFDIFVVLVVALALATVLGRKWGAAAFLMLLLIYHQAGAPLLLWLNLVIVLWLLQWLKNPRWQFLLGIYRDLSFVLLAVMIIWLSASSLKNSLYPQSLEKTQQFLPKAVSEEMAAPEADMLMSRQSKAESRPMSEDPFAVPIDAKTQTGPALPQWQGKAVDLNWHTPVASEQSVYLVLLPPVLLRLLTVMQIILLLGVGLRLFKIRKQPLTVISFPRSSVLSVSLLACLLSSMPMPGHANTIPDAALLEQLQTRLLAPEDCLAHCGSISQAVVTANHAQVSLALQVEALADVAIPIPGRSAYWQAEQVLVDNIPATGLTWQNNTLMVQLDKGTHAVVVSGAVNDIDKLSLEFPLAPHWISVEADGWFAEGVEQAQLSGNTLHLSRRQKSMDVVGDLMGIKPFVRVVRSLSLGLEGAVTTRVERVAPVTGPIQLSIPLLPHESISSENVRVHNNRAQVYLSADQREVTWQSNLTHFTDLTLLAPQSDAWVEEWELQVSPIWHPAITGVPALYESAYHVWQSVWQPWPLQSVHVQLVRPEAMPGQTLTIDRVDLLTTASARGRDFSLQALLRSTLGDQHKLILPKDIKVQQVQVNGVAQLGQQVGNEIILLLSPGNNWVDIAWQSPEPVAFFTRTPLLDWSMPAYNINMGMNIPSDRWILALGGAGYGPAMLYWMWVVGAIILAVILGKMSATPLSVKQWLVLGVGLSLVTPFLGLWVIVALVLLSLRERFTQPVKPRIYLLMQTGMGVLIAMALLILFNAIVQGLSGMPQMQIVASSMTSTVSADYFWLQDLSMKVWPRAWIISLPLWVYRGLMLLWSLWLVFMLLRLIPWGWRVMTRV